MAQADSNHTTNAPTARPPESPQDSLYFPTDISPEELFKAIGRLRKEARDEIDRLIRFLDDTDNHMEREPDGSDEPSLGFLDGMPGKGMTAGTDDLECDDEDDEPSLGSRNVFNGGEDQTSWGAGIDDDRERDDGETGIADDDGILEQIGQQDWQPKGVL